MASRGSWPARRSSCDASGSKPKQARRARQAAAGDWRLLSQRCTRIMSDCVVCVRMRVGDARAAKNVGAGSAVHAVVCGEITHMSHMVTLHGTIYKT